MSESKFVIGNTYFTETYDGKRKIYLHVIGRTQKYLEAAIKYPAFSETRKILIRKGSIGSMKFEYVSLNSETPFIRAIDLK